MPEQRRAIVTNTTPLITLAAATGGLDVLRFLYEQVIVPVEVKEEIQAGGKDAFGLDVFAQATWMECREDPVRLPPYLANSLDRGEAAVIQTALNEGISLVAIDETVGRRVARLCGLNLTGSVGILLKAKEQGYSVSIPEALQRMRERGIWLSEKVVQFALTRAQVMR